jgi:hypothetical protein
MNQFTEQQLQGIISPDKERLIYEIANSSASRRVGMFGYWPSEKLGNYFTKDSLDCYNSQGKQIATFKLKSWKS